MNKAIVCLIIACIIVNLSSCGSNQERIYVPTLEVYSVTVTTHDWEEKQSTRNSVYRQDDMEEFLLYFGELKGTKVDSVEVINNVTKLYSIEMNSDSMYQYLLAGDYIITFDGEIFLIDGDKTEEVCELIVGDSKVREGLVHISNHRALSLNNAEWNPQFMYESPYGDVNKSNIELEIVEQVIKTDAEKIEYKIKNILPYQIEYGSEVYLETKIDDKWYAINDMLNEDITLTWTSILNLLNPNSSEEYVLFISHFTPLPCGEYRIVKEVDSLDNTNGIIYGEFRVED